MLLVILQGELSEPLALEVVVKCGGGGMQLGGKRLLEEYLVWVGVCSQAQGSRFFGELDMVLHLVPTDGANC